MAEPFSLKPIRENEMDGCGIDVEAHPDGLHLLGWFEGDGWGTASIVDMPRMVIPWADLMAAYEAFMAKSKEARSSA